MLHSVLCLLIKHDLIVMRCFVCCVCALVVVHCLSCVECCLAVATSFFAVLLFVVCGVPCLLCSVCCLLCVACEFVCSVR